MPKIAFVGQSRQDQDNRGSNTARLINCYREAVGEGKHVLKPVLGMRSFAETGSVFTRAAHVMNGALYAVVGGVLFSIASDGTATNLGAVVDSEETTIDSNNGVLTIVAGGRYWTWDGTTLSEPGTGAFPSFGSVDFIGQRTILTEKDGRRFQWSDVAAPDTLSGAFATTESRDDNNLRVVAFADTLWFFKEKSIEQWYETGDSDVFAPMGGGAIDIGLKGYGLVVKAPRALFFVGTDNKVHIASGGGAKPISTVAVETAIKNSTPTHCFYYQDEGHEFIVVRFDDRPAWVFDLSMGEWHERAEGLGLGAWSATAAVNAYGRFLTATLTGEFFEMVPSGMDGTIPVICEAQSLTLHMDSKRFNIPMLELFGRVGVHDVGAPEILQIEGLEVLDAGDGGALLISDGDPDAQAQIELYVSRDWGHTWSAPKPRGLGVRGDYDKRLVWRGLGRFRQVTARVRWSDSPGIPINAEAVVRAA